jgi:1-acyl-sn-glycerol-3-phosphate acyltransferase
MPPTRLARADAPPDRMTRLYAAVRLLGRFWVWFLFKRVDVRHVERVPAAGPVLLCINHPNNLIDSLLLGVVLDRPVHYLATATLFRNPWLARLLRACGAIAVYRRQDDPDDAGRRAGRNADTFAACRRAFTEGCVVAIYPEGTTHAEARVQRIKTGAARIALDYEAERPGALTVVPVGLSFEARKAFGGRVLVSFGPPLPLAPYASASSNDPGKAVDTLTTGIQWAMEAEVVHVDRIDAAAVVRAVEELYRDRLVRELEEDRGLGRREVDLFRLSRTIVDAVTHFKAREPQRVERIWQRIEGYRALLARYRVRDEVVQARLARAPARRRLLRTWQAVAGFPIFAYGAAVNALPYLLPRWLARRLARKETDYATVRLLATVVAVPLFWSAEIAVVARLAGARWAAVFAATLPVTGLLAYHYWRGVGRLRRALSFSLLAATRDQAARALVAERQAIVTELDRAKTEYLAATRGSSF